MKKILPAIAVLTILMTLAACGDRKSIDITQYKNPSSADSMLFYFVQLRAHEYWEKAAKDTMMRSKEAREKFLEGFDEGFSLVNDDPDYNRGVELGVRMATNFKNFEKLYSVKFNTDLVLPSFRYGLQDGMDIPELNYQEKFYDLLNRMKNEQRTRDHAKAKLSLIEEARHQQMTKISENLYYRVLKNGEGPYLKEGNSAYVVVNYERADGQDIGVPSPGLITVGSNGMPEVSVEAYTRLNKGAVALFATTAEALFGTRTYIMGMKPEDVLLITVTLNEIVSAHSIDGDSI